MCKVTLSFTTNNYRPVSYTKEEHQVAGIQYLKRTKYINNNNIDFIRFETAPLNPVVSCI